MKFITIIFSFAIISSNAFAIQFSCPEQDQETYKFTNNFKSKI